MDILTNSIYNQAGEAFNINSPRQLGIILFEKLNIPHGKLIKREASGEKLDFSLILVHAEDQLMSADAFKILAQEFIDVYKRIED